MSQNAFAGIKGESVGIGRLERFVADYHRLNNNETAVKPEANGHKVAVVGSGPAGLSCAGELAKRGYDVTIFEAFHVPGGVLSYGIPEFRLPKAIVKNEISGLENLGVKVMTNMVIGKVLSIDELFDMGFEGGICRFGRRTSALHEHRRRRPYRGVFRQ